MIGSISPGKVSPPTIILLSKMVILWVLSCLVLLSSSYVYGAPASKVTSISDAEFISQCKMFKEFGKSLFKTNAKSKDVKDEKVCGAPAINNIPNADSDEVCYQTNTESRKTWKVTLNADGTKSTVCFTPDICGFDRPRKREFTSEFFDAARRKFEKSLFKTNANSKDVTDKKDCGAPAINNIPNADSDEVCYEINKESLKKWKVSVNADGTKSTVCFTADICGFGRPPQREFTSEFLDAARRKFGKPRSKDKTNAKSNDVKDEKGVNTI